MDMNMNIDLSQKQVLSQRMVQTMEILQMSAQELESYIEELSIENPVVELASNMQTANSDQHSQDDLHRKLDWLESTDYQNKVYYQQERDSNSLQDDWNLSNDSENLLSDYLSSQLLSIHYNPIEREILEYLILSIDSRGYFTESLSDVAVRFNVDEDIVHTLLLDIQELDPAGIGACNLQECLLLQIERKKEALPTTKSLDMINTLDLAAKIVKDHLNLLGKNHLSHISKQLHISMEELEDACDVIRSLNPKPGSSYSSREQLNYITPDIVVVKLKENFEILINEYQYPKFSISSFYREMLSTSKDDDVQKYLKQKIQQAEWVSNCITQRTSTLSLVTHVIVEKQQDFFLYGPKYKHPLRLSDIAEELNFHESTISRAMRGKYLQCSYGVFPLNFFLTAFVLPGDSSRQDALTSDQIKDVIKKIIANENKEKPFSDRLIGEELEKHNIKISRRTVAKYREELGIPDKSGRKDWH